MRPVPLEEATVQQLGGGLRRVLAAPNGDLTDEQVAPLEVLIQQCTDGSVIYSSVWTLDDGDLLTLAAGGRVHLTVIGGQPPVALNVIPEPS